MFPLEFDIYRIFWKVLVLVVLILFFGVSQLSENQDEAQIIDVEKVSSCPATKMKWLEDATAKNCSSKNVTFKYHCLLNHWRNQSFVLCGEDKEIIGYVCPEYDERRSRIQVSSEIKCIESNPPCPFKYNSSEVFKYPACIESKITDISNREAEETTQYLRTNYLNEIKTIPIVSANRIHIIAEYAKFILLGMPLMVIFILQPVDIVSWLLERRVGENHEDIELSTLHIDEPSIMNNDLLTSHIDEPSIMNNDLSTLHIDEPSIMKLVENKEAWSQPINSPIIKKLFGSIIEEIQQPTSDMSFAPELLNGVNLNNIILEIKSLSREVLLNNMNSTTVDTSNNEHGKVYVAEVTVTCKKNQLTINQKDPYEWKRFLQANQTDIVRVILIHSKSVRVIEAKLKVYREYKTVIDSSNIFLQHVYDDFEEISKLSIHNKLAWLCDAVQLLSNSVHLEYLNKILKTALDRALTEENISRLCLENNVCPLRTIIEYLESQIYFEILLQVKLLINRNNLLQLKLKIRKVITGIFISNKSWLTEDINLNAEEIQERAAIDISCKRRKVFEDILSAIYATADDLKNVLRKLTKLKQELKLADQKEAVKTWEKREALQCLQGLERYPSVLKYIAGWKDNKPTIKVFLSYGDTEAKDFFKHNNQIPNGTCFEFVNIAKKSKEKIQTAKVDYSSFPDEDYVRTGLGNIINKHAKKLYAKHSSIVGLDAPVYMLFKGEVQPCIIIYSLDKDLIPYGEDPLPTSLEGWHCDVREDIVMFGMCFDCRQIPYPNPGCCIGLPSNGIGSAGFLAKTKGSKLPVTGFLTAAHVAAKNWTDLYDFNDLLSNLATSDCRDEIVHPLLPGYTQYQIVGKVRESFCGNWGEEGIGMDAAFVQNSEPRHGEYSELQIADENILQFNVDKVMKRGGTTGQTEGLLTGNTFSVCVDKDFNLGGFYYFARCFSIESIDRPFFEKGDSGSGVFLVENGRPTKPLGIAFAKLLINHNTAVCRIDKIVEAFGLSVYHNKEPKEAFQHEEPMEI